LVGGIVVVFGVKVKVFCLYGGCTTLKRGADCVSTLSLRSAPEQAAGQRAGRRGFHEPGQPLCGFSGVAHRHLSLRPGQQNSLPSPEILMGALPKILIMDFLASPMLSNMLKLR